jgi:hypothetical protein
LATMIFLSSNFLCLTIANWSNPNVRADSRVPARTGLLPESDNAGAI